jgi:hypothetical protein
VPVEVVFSITPFPASAAANARPDSVLARQGVRRSARLSRPLVSGSYLTISHGTSDHQSAAAVEATRRLFTRATAPWNLRGHAEVRRFFDGFDILEPGLVFTPQWRPDVPVPFRDQPERSWAYGAVGRKP